MEEIPKMPLIETKEDEYFFRLVIAKSKIRQQGIEIGMLQSEIEELKFELTKYKNKEKEEASIEIRSKEEKKKLYVMQEVISQLISKNNNNIKVDNLEDLITMCVRKPKWKKTK